MMKRVTRALSAYAWAKAIESCIVIAATLAVTIVIGWMAWNAVKVAAEVGGF